MPRRYALLLGCVVLAAVVAGVVAGRLAEPRKPEPPRTREECVARGGEWIMYPMLQSWFCAIRTGDAGRACSDDRQCQGDCVPAEGRGRLAGVCAPTLPMPGGCPRHLVDGKVIEEPCI